MSGSSPSNRKYRVAYKKFHSRLRQLGHSGRFANPLLDAAVLGKEPCADLRQLGLIDRTKHGWDLRDPELQSLAALEVASLKKSVPRRATVHANLRGQHSGLAQALRRRQVGRPGCVANLLLEVFSTGNPYVSKELAARHRACTDGHLTSLSKQLMNEGFVIFDPRGKQRWIWSPGPKLLRYLEPRKRIGDAQKKMDDTLQNKGAQGVNGPSTEQDLAQLQARISTLEAERECAAIEVDGLKRALTSIAHATGGSWGPEMFGGDELLRRVQGVISQRDGARKRCEELERRLVSTFNDYLWTASTEVQSM